MTKKINWHVAKRIGMYSLFVIALFGSGLLVGRALIPDYISFEYLHRTMTNGQSEVTDWREVFPKRPIQNNPGNVAELNTGASIDTAAFSALTYHKSGQEFSIGSDMQKFLADTNTDSFLVVKNDHIIHEAYLKDTKVDTIRASMSTAKSFLSALVGIAIEEKYITSVNESVVRYIPELKGKISDKMTIQHLLTMSGGNTYHGTGGLTGDDTKTYWSPDLRRIALDYFRSNEEPGSHMQYNDFQPQVLGMILERTTGKSIAEYMQEKLWKPAGMKKEASWSLDSKEHGFEQSAVGINAVSRDFARFGQLYLHEGKMNNRQVIPKNWVLDSTTMKPQNDEYFVGWHDSNLYGYYWWGNQRDDGAQDYYARGKHGQFIYISPASNTVIVRTGSSTGHVQDWPELFEQMTTK